MDELVIDLQTIEVSETLKIHGLTKHLKQCLDVFENDGLGQWSEQSKKSVHGVFLDFWNRY